MKRRTPGLGTRDARARGRGIMLSRRRDERMTTDRANQHHVASSVGRRRRCYCGRGGRHPGAPAGARTQWRRNRGFRRFNEPGPPSSWDPEYWGTELF